MFNKHTKKRTYFLVSMLLFISLLFVNFGNIAVATDAEILQLQLGGAYNSIPYAYGGDRHHTFAGEVYDNTYVYKFDSNHNVTGYVTRETGPCILMTKADHQQTASWGSSSAAQAYRAQQLSLIQQGRHLGAVQMDINDIRAKFGGRYDGAISKMWSYATNTLHWWRY